MLNSSIYSRFKALKNAQPENIQKYLAIFWLILMICIAEIAMLFAGILAGTFVGYEHGLFYLAVFSSAGRIMSLIVFLILMYLVYVHKVKDEILNRIVEVDERGVAVMEKGTFGTAKMMNEDEIRETFNVGDIKDCNTTIYGCIHDSTDVVSRNAEEKTLANNNLLIIGGSGSGKSTGRIFPDIYMSIRNGESFAMLDVKGEGYNLTANKAKQEGYDVLVFNLADPTHSNFWNMLRVTINRETERMDDTKLDDFVYTLLKNTQAVENAGKPNPYFMNMGIALMKSVIAFMAWRREKFLLIGYNELFRRLCAKGSKITGVNEWYESHKSAFTDIGADRNDRFTKANFRECKRLIREAAEKVNADMSSVESAIRKIETKAPPFTMAEVYYLMLNYSETSEIWKEIPQNYSAWQNRAIISGGQSSGTENNAPTDDEIKSAVQNTVSELTALQSDVFRTIISNDDIDFTTVRKRKTAIYVIIDPKNKKMIPYTSLFFTYLERTVKESWDIYKARPEDPVTNPEPLSFAFIMDEFYSAGLIGGDPSVMVQSLATCRSMKYRWHIVVQTYDMIASLYTPEGRNNIIGNCATIIYLGSTDVATQEYISKISGTMTVGSQNYRNETNVLGMEPSLNIGENRRPLITVEEAKAFIGKGEVLLFYGGKNPCHLKQYRNYMMPDEMTGKDLGPAYIEQDIESIQQRFHEDRDSFTIDNIDARGNTKISDTLNTGGDDDGANKYSEPTWKKYCSNIAQTITFQRKKHKKTEMANIDDLLKTSSDSSVLDLSGLDDLLLNDSDSDGMEKTQELNTEEIKKEEDTKKAVEQKPNSAPKAKSKKSSSKRIRNNAVETAKNDDSGNDPGLNI